MSAARTEAALPARGTRAGWPGRADAQRPDPLEFPTFWTAASSPRAFRTPDSWARMLRLAHFGQLLWRRDKCLGLSGTVRHGGSTRHQLAARPKATGPHVDSVNPNLRGLGCSSRVLRLRAPWGRPVTLGGTS